MKNGDIMQRSQDAEKMRPWECFETSQ